MAGADSHPFGSFEGVVTGCGRSVLASGLPRAEIAMTRPAVSASGRLLPVWSASLAAPGRRHRADHCCALGPARFRWQRRPPAADTQFVPHAARFQEKSGASHCLAGAGSYQWRSIRQRVSGAGRQRASLWRRSAVAPKSRRGAQPADSASCTPPAWSGRAYLFSCFSASWTACIGSGAAAPSCCAAGALPSGAEAPSPGVAGAAVSDEGAPKPGGMGGAL